MLQEVDELFYITDMIDFSTWTERELNTFDLIEKKLKPALKKELKKQGITSGMLVYLLFD